MDDLGHKVFPAEIENILNKHPNVKSVCVVAKKHKEKHFVPVAFIVLNECTNKNKIVNELIDLCSRELPKYAQPYGFTFRDSLPLTPIGKVDYKALENEAEKIFSE